MTLRYVTYQDPAGAEGFGLLRDDGIVDLRGRTGRRDLADLIGADGLSAAGAYAAEPVDFALADVRLKPVIPRPNRILCVGLNYRAHVAETGRADTERPTIFLRLASSQVAHGEALLRPPESTKFDYEGELAVIIGKGGRRISEAQAMEHVAGYACYNDVTVRDWQRHTTQWGPGKNFVGTGAFGPWMIPAAALPPRDECSLVTRVNGAEAQRAKLSQMIFSIEELIAYTSVFTPLEPGDVIVSGTPGGIGDRRDPPLYLAHGDRVTVEIDGIGVLENPVIDE